MKQENKYYLSIILEDIKKNNTKIPEKMKLDIINNLASLETILSVTESERLTKYLGNIFGYQLKDGVSELDLVERAYTLSLDKRLYCFFCNKEFEHTYYTKT